MPQITNITAQKRNQDIYNIEVDGKFLCGIGVLEVSSRGLKIGQEISSDGLADLVQSSLGSKAYNASLRYLSYRPRSEYELRQYLARKSYDEDVATATIGRLAAEKYVDDLEFARSWIRSRSATKHSSSRVLRMELMKKGIGRDVLDTALGEIESADEQANLRKVLIKKMRLARYANDAQKSVAYLVSQGFRYSDVREAMSVLAAENNESNDSTD